MERSEALYSSDITVLHFARNLLYYRYFPEDGSFYLNPAFGCWWHINEVLTLHAMANEGDYRWKWLSAGLVPNNKTIFSMIVQ